MLHIIIGVLACIGMTYILLLVEDFMSRPRR